MWEKLTNVNETVLANYLKNEYPQTVAVVLSKLRPEHAARVLSILPEELALDVVARMLRMEAEEMGHYADEICAMGEGNARSTSLAPFFSHTLPCCWPEP